MQCPQCQQDNPPRAKFCLECGSRLVLTCTQYDTELPAGAKFCLGKDSRLVSARCRPSCSACNLHPKHLAENS